MRIVFVSHCGVHDNSSIHILGIAAELSRRGYETAILVSGIAQQSSLAPNTQVLSYEAPDLRWKKLEADIIHAWTPRERVRIVTMALQSATDARIVVHMEDNERQIFSNVSGFPYPLLKMVPSRLFDMFSFAPDFCAHPHRGERFLAEADGYTCLIDTLMEFKPSSMAGTVFWPGLYPDFVNMPVPDPGKYGFRREDIVIVYTGNIHESVASEFTELQRAIAAVRARGYPVALIKTGKDSVGIEKSDFTVDLGFIDHSELPSLLAIASILIQPGAPSRFNNYRLPSKLPEYLVSGRPVVLPDCNIGRVLRDEEHVLKLQDGNSKEIAAKIERLIEDPVLATRLGANSRKFALENFSWTRAADRIEAIYQQAVAKH